MENLSNVFMGLEIEYIAPQYINGGDQQADNDPRWVCPPPSMNPWTAEPYDVENEWAGLTAIKKSCELIAGTGISVACQYPDRDTTRRLVAEGAQHDEIYHAPEENSVSLRLWNSHQAVPVPGAKKREFSSWFVVQELHITRDLKTHPAHAPASGYRWTGLELNSPIITSADEITNGLPTLGKALKSLTGGMRVGINKGCGLHFHATNRGNLDIDTAKRVAGLVMLIEETLLVPLCHPSRHGNPFAAPISSSSVAALSLRPAFGLTGDGAVQIKALEELAETIRDRPKVHGRTLEALRRIYATVKLEDLRKALKKFDEGPARTTRRCALVVSRHDTLEFRYPASTFDVDYIASWAKLVRHVFAVALAPAASFSELCCRVYELVTRDGQVSWPDVMEAIGFAEVHPDAWRKCLSELPRDMDGQGFLPRR